MTAAKPLRICSNGEGVHERFELWHWVLCGACFDGFGDDGYQVEFMLYGHLIFRSQLINELVHSADCVFSCLQHVVDERRIVFDVVPRCAEEGRVAR